MALRSLDNALPASIERPKKVAKVAHGDPCKNDENSPLQLQPKTADRAAEYIASHELEALEDPDTAINNLLAELDSKEWIKACGTLNDVRRFALHHSSLLFPILGKVMMLVAKAMKSPRSALCKTSIMACSDIFPSFGHSLFASSEEEQVAFDTLLLQLLQKASQDKRFVCEEAEKALEAMAVSLSPLPLLKKLQSSVSHSNPRVRAKSAITISKCVSRMDSETMKEFGLVTLLQLAVELLNDRLPEAREAARSIVNSVYGVFSNENNFQLELWENFCSSNLSPVSALLVSKIVLR